MSSRNLGTATGTVHENVEFTASDGAAGDQFGNSVSQSGTIGLVGADGKNSYQGAAYVFRNLDTATGTVHENVQLTASDGAAYDYFGYSVSQSGTIGLVGAFAKNSDQGAAYVFRNLDTASGTVTEKVELTASDGAAYDDFGYAVSLAGDRFIIGAPGKNSSTGAAYTGTISSMTTLDDGSASRTIDGLSFVSQDNWIIGQATSANQVTLNPGNTANVTASGKAVYIGQNAGSNNNTLIVVGDLIATQITVGAVGNTGNILQLGAGGITGTLSPGSLITNNGTVVFNRSDIITQGTDFGSAAITGTGGVTNAGTGATILTAANGYTGATMVNGGTLQAGVASVANISGAFGKNSAVSMANVAGATLDITGFNTQIGSLTGGGTTGGNVTLGAATLTLGGDNTSPAAYAGVLSGIGGGVTKTGTGTQTLSGTNTYTGATTVSQGTLLVSGSISGSMTTVSGAGSTLGGTGTVGGVNVGSGAILEGGDGSGPSGALSSGGAVSLASGSEIELTLGPSGTHSSLIDSGGTWSFDSDQAFVFNIAPGASGSTTYDDLITGLNGTEPGLAYDSNGLISNWQIATPGVTGTFFYDGHGNIDLTLVAIPEPGAAGLLLAGLPLLGWRRRRR